MAVSPRPAQRNWFADAPVSTLDGAQAELLRAASALPPSGSESVEPAATLGDPRPSEVEVYPVIV